jgi:hypothetical protein
LIRPEGEERRKAYHGCLRVRLDGTGEHQDEGFDVDRPSGDGRDLRQKVKTEAGKVEQTESAFSTEEIKTYRER